jgi:UDP-N-acetylmuramate-alanine ligase
MGQESLSHEGLSSCEDEQGLVKHIEMKAGDVILFMGSGQIHGTKHDIFR